MLGPFLLSLPTFAAGCGEGLLLMSSGVHPVGSVCLARMAAALRPIVIDEENFEVDHWTPIFISEAFRTS